MCGVHTTWSILSSGRVVSERLFVVYIDRGNTWTASVQRSHQRARRDQACTARVDEQCRRLHARKVLLVDDPASRLGPCPNENVHAERLAIFGDGAAVPVGGETLCQSAGQVRATRI